ncbi:MAG: alcohol dehydrogenase catalytic domain-containing protein [Anaerolineae bacterium]
MKAAVYHGNRDIRIESAPEPDKPGPDEVLLAVQRAAICGTDVTEYLHGPHFTPLSQRHPASGHLGPLIVGHEFVGRVIEVGSEVEGFKAGQRVVPGAGMWCGQCEWCRAGQTNLCARYYTLGLNAPGGLAELVKAPVQMCRPVPENCSDDAAAMGQPLAVALHAVRRGGAQPGQTVALMGVGGIGAFILAAAKAQGVSPLIALDIDEERLETARRLGADYLINARNEDPLQRLQEVTDGAGVHLFMEASGAPHAPALALDATRRGGKVLLVGLQTQPRSLDLHKMVLREIDVTTTVAHVCSVDLPESLEILATTPLAEVVLGAVIPLEGLVHAGLLAMAEGRAKGKIVVNPQ